MKKEAILKLCDLIVESEELDRNGQYEEAEDLLIAVCEALGSMTKTSKFNPFTNPKFWKEPLKFLEHAGKDLMGKVPPGRKWGRHLQKDISDQIQTLVNTTKPKDVKSIFPGISDKVADKIAQSRNEQEILSLLSRSKLLPENTMTPLRPLTKMKLWGSGIAGTAGLSKGISGSEQNDSSRGEVYPEETENKPSVPYKPAPYQPFSGGSAYQ